jgi:hypothetical protein
VTAPILFDHDVRARNGTRVRIQVTPALLVSVSAAAGLTAEDAELVARTLRNAVRFVRNRQADALREGSP